MPIERTITCIPGDGCPAGVAVVQVSHDLDAAREDIKEEHLQRQQNVTVLHARVDRVEDRINAILMMTIGTLVGMLANIALTLLRSK